VRKIVDRVPKKSADAFFLATLPPEIDRLTKMDLKPIPRSSRSAPALACGDRDGTRFIRGGATRNSTSSPPFLEKPTTTGLIFSRTKFARQDRAKLKEAATPSACAFQSHATRRSRRSKFQKRNTMMVATTSPRAHRRARRQPRHHYDVPQHPETRAPLSVAPAARKTSRRVHAFHRRGFDHVRAIEHFHRQKTRG